MLAAASISEELRSPEWLIKSLSYPQNHSVTRLLCPMAKGLGLCQVDRAAGSSVPKPKGISEPNPDSGLFHELAHVVRTCQSLIYPKNVMVAPVSSYS